MASEPLLMPQAAKALLAAATDDEYSYQKTFQLGRYRENDSDMGASLGTKRRVVSDGHSSPFADSSRLKEKKRRRFLCNPGRIAKVFRFVLEDWIYLALLGLLMAVCSLAMDFAIEELQDFHVKAYGWAKRQRALPLTYLVWVVFCVLLTVCSALFAHYVAPQAIGSGIPEMKVILRGVILKEYLTLRTLVSKMVGLTLSLGSGLPIGKEGPFVHVASVVANMLSRLVQSFQGIYTNESRSSEMLAAGCAVGVACTFSAPVGGVLFSIEVTSVYFAVRNYWRGFFAATCSATIFRVLRVFLFASEVTVVAYYQTNFPKEAFFPEELPAFAFIGLFCGLAGSAFIWLHRTTVLFLRRNRYAKSIFQKYWLIYPALISFMVSTITYPKGFGQFLAGEQKFSQTLKAFFRNCTWTVPVNHSLACRPELLTDWKGHNGENSVFVALVAFQITFFLLAVIASTLPIPAGIFMPVFVIGGCFGRTVGEVVATWYPNGMRAEESLQVWPGVYAVVGAAAFCGAVTHTVSVAVIVFELTGQLLYILPVMIAVLIANAVCSYLQPSIYDSIIKIKHLPYLPDIPHSSSIFHGIHASQIMVSGVRFVSKDSTYGEVQDLLLAMPRLRAFPVVESKKSMVLLGSTSKAGLHKLLEDRVGTRARQAEATKRVREAIESVDRRFRAATADTNGNALSNGVALGQKRTSHRFTIQPVSPSVDEVSNEEKMNEEATRSTDHLDVTNEAFVVELLFWESRTLQPTRKISQSTSGEAIFAMGMKRYRSGPTLDDSQNHDVYHTIGGMFRTITHSLVKKRKDQTHTDFDLQGDERLEWERSVLASKVDFTDLVLDPAPFQLVEHSSLFKVHSLFSLLGLNRAYVTKCGTLVGVVALKELRVAIERAQTGLLSPDGRSMHADSEDSEGGVTVGEEDNDDDSDYEDNLQPRLEIVSRTTTPDELLAVGVEPPTNVEDGLASRSPASNVPTETSSREPPSTVIVPDLLTPQASEEEKHRDVPNITLNDEWSFEEEDEPKMNEEARHDDSGRESLHSGVDERPAFRRLSARRSSTPDGILCRSSEDEQSTASDRLSRRKKNDRHVKIVMPPSPSEGEEQQPRTFFEA